MAICKECGANIPEGVRFCTQCGAPAVVEPQPEPVAAVFSQAKTAPEAPKTPAFTASPPQTPVYNQQPHYQKQSAPAYHSYSPEPSPPAGKYSVMSTGSFFGHTILFAIPVIGWLICLITAFASKKLNKRNFARSTLIFLIIGLVFSAAAYFIFNWFFDAIRDSLKDATGGDFNHWISNFN